MCVAVRRARGAFLAAAAAEKAARRECTQAMWRAWQVFVAGQAVETRQVYAARHLSDEEWERWLVERDEASARTMAAAFDPVDAAGRDHGRACEALLNACKVYRDACAAAAERRQHRLGERRREEMCDTGESTGRGPAEVLLLPLGAGGERCGDGELVEVSGSAEGQEVGRRGRVAAGRASLAPARGLSASGERLEGAGGAGPTPAARARLVRVRGARGRRPGRRAPSRQQVGQPSGRPPGCHRGARCTAGEGKLGKGPWLGDGG